MPSAERARTLEHQLAWTLVLVSTLAAALALAAALITADALLRSHVERSAQDAAHIMAVELGEDLGLVSEVEEEARELGIDGRVAVVRGATVIAGDQSLAAAAVAADLRRGHVQECSTLDDATADLVCRQSLHGGEGLAVLVAVDGDRIVGHRLPLVLAGLAGLAVVVLGAALTGLVLARRFLAPLDRLRQAVVDVDATAPAAVELPARTGLEEIDAMQAALASLLARLETELVRTRRFAAHAAHELRTPLARMLTELELAVEVASTPEHAATLTKVQHATERLIVLTERLLLLATPHEALATAQATSLSQLVEDLRTQRPATEAARIVIETGDSDGLVCGDAVLLGVLLDNVVDNALKFSSGPVRVAVHERDGHVVLEVADDGPGVPAEQAELFEPFRRGARAAHLPGHGLGLAIVAHIARACGGQARFHDHARVGACLEVWLPAVEARGNEPATRECPRGA